MHIDCRLWKQQQIFSFHTQAQATLVSTLSVDATTKQNRGRNHFQSEAHFAPSCRFAMKNKIGKLEAIGLS